MNFWNPISERTPKELRQRAEQFRRLAATARTVDVHEALVELAEDFENAAETPAAGWKS